MPPWSNGSTIVQSVVQSAVLSSILHTFLESEINITKTEFMFLSQSVELSQSYFTSEVSYPYTLFC